MIYSINGALLALSSSLAVSLVTKATMMTAIALAGTWLARASRAAVRHSILAACFGGLVALPAASVLVHPLRIAMPLEPEAASSASTNYDLFQTTPDAVPNAEVRSSTLRWKDSDFPLWGFLLGGWMAGVAVFALRMTVGLREVHLLRRSGLPWRDGQAIIDRLASETGVDRRVQLLLQESLPTPVTCGIFCPTIVLPSDAQNWLSEDLNRAIVHELEHVRRRDWMSQCLARAVCAAYWFHPLVWIVWCRLSLEAERACDDAVVRCSEGTAYADQLIGLARRLATAQRSPFLAMANRSDLATRVGAVLDNGQRRGRAGRIPLALACLTAAALVLTISPLTLVGAPQATSNKPLFEVASVKLHKPTPGPFRSTKDVGDAGINFTNVDLNSSIRSAYGVAGYQIAGGLSWLTPDRYDIVARAAAPAPKAQLMLMLQTLLAGC